ncbi:hypothetical protein BDV18DRAFT_147345 [Aspergillus unguis]
MKYKSPQVEDYDTDDVTNTSKRKREDDTPIIEEDRPDNADLQQPPSKATRSGGRDKKEEANDEEANDEEFLDDDGELEDGNLDEDLSQEGYEDDESEGSDDAQVEKNKKDTKKNKSKAPSRGSGSPSSEKLQKTIEMYGRGPLEGTAIEKDALSGSSDTVLAMLMDAMLKSRPLSHELTDRTLRKLVEVGYHDINKLGNATWEERAMVLKDGGYNRYREQGSTNLGKLVEFVNEKYDGDLNNLLEEAGHDPQKTKQLVKEVHGLGDLGVELFFNNVQSVWPAIAPFVDSRSMETAKDAGLGTDLDAIYDDLGQDSVRMCKLANALSAARLDRRVGDLVAI